MQIFNKASLEFIMNKSENINGIDQDDVAFDTTVTSTVDVGSKSNNTRKHCRSAAKNQKRKARECKVEGCENYVVAKGLCFRHGGGKKCSTEGCEASVKHAGLCWRHGGWVMCKVDNCSRRGKARGFCWSHGGGTKCSHAACPKIAITNGLCWAHGGGKRCVYQGCKTVAYERNNNYCSKHYEK